MKKVNCRVAYIITIACSISLFACADTGGKESLPASVINKDKNKMFDYPLGRFSIALPENFKSVVQTHRLRACEIKEFVWPQGADRQQVRDGVWHERIDNIRRLERPSGVKKVIVDQRFHATSPPWIKAVFYYGNYAANDVGYWDLLLDAGEIGVWFKFHGVLEGKEELYDWVVEIAKAYKSRNPSTAGVIANDRFHLQYGAIHLPYLAQEQTYARFDGHPLDLKLEIEMQETHHVEQAGLMERLAAAVVTRYLPGVDVDKIRGRKRTVAGLKGEDVIVRMKDKYRTMLSFAWEFAGEEDSGERPEIQITMESTDGALEEKIKIWDAILDSFKPMYPLTK